MSKKEAQQDESAEGSAAGSEDGSADDTAVTTPAEPVALTDDSVDNVEAPAEAVAKRWPWILATASLAIVLIGLGVFAITQHQSLNENQAALASTTVERDDLQSRVDDRDEQRLADEAAASKATADAATAVRIAAEKQAAADKAAADKVAAAEAAEAAATAARNTIPGSGTFEIGSEKSPGTYKTSGPKDSTSCYYAVLRSPSGGSSSNIIDNDIISGQGIVSLSAGQFFETSRCNDWVKQ